MRHNSAARIGIVGAAIIVAVILVGGYLLVSSLNVTVPDMNPSTHSSGAGSSSGSGSGGGSSGGCGVTSCTNPPTTVGPIGYVDSKIRVTIAGTLTCDFLSIHCLSEVHLAGGGFQLNAHEVLTPATGAATIFAPLGLTFGSDCHARATGYFTTPDDSGKSESSEALFALDNAMVFQMGHLNMYSKGQVSMTFQIEVKGCGFLNDWTALTNGKIGPLTFLFDGTDNYSY